MQKKLLSGLFWVLLLNIVVKPFWILGIEAGVQSAVGTEMYGFYFSIFNLAYIFNILLDLGVTNFNTRNIAQHPGLINKHLPGILSIKFLLLGLYLVITFSTGLLMGYSSKQFLLLAFLSFNQFLNSLILYLRSNFEGLLMFKWDSVISIMDRVLMILICGFLLWGTDIPFKIEYFVWAQTAAYLITAIIAFIAIARKAHFRGLRWNKPFSMVILKKSAPFALLVLLMASYNRIDPVLLKQLLPNGDFQAGIYAGAFRLLEALTMIAYLFSVPLLPIYSRLLTKKQEVDSSQISEITQLMFSLVWIFSLTAAITFWTLSEPLMDLIYNENLPISQYADVFRILIFGIIPISTTYVFGTLLTANGSLKQLNILAATTLIINVAVNLICIPRLGAVGSAWASLAAQSFMAITQLILSLRIFHIRPSLRYVCRLIFQALFIVAFNLLCLYWNTNIWITMAFVGIGTLAASFALKLINIKKLINYIQE